MAFLILGLVVFLASHSVRIFADDARTRFIAQRGENAYKGLYTVASLIGLVLIIYGYATARAAGPAVLYDPPIWMRHITVTLMWFSFVALSAMKGKGWINSRLKHPMLVGIKIWAFAHLLANGDVASVVLFGAFLAWAVVDRISAKRRAGEADAHPKYPFGRPDIIAIVAGSVLYVIFLFWAHQWLIGVSPL